MIPNLSIIVLTFNEAIHLERLLDNLMLLTDKIYVVDSYSTDETTAILEAKHIIYKQHAFVNHSKQINFAIDSNPFETTWTMRMDADELISEALKNELVYKLGLLDKSEINGFYLKRKVKFFGKELNYGNLNPMWLLRIWRNGEGVCNEKWMDEKIVLKNPKTLKLDHVFYDHNLNDLTWWTQKHNHYASREAIEILKERYLRSTNSTKKASNRDLVLFALKSFYNKVPIFLRPILLFLYSYFMRLGFLDGKQGLVWNILQVLWYRFLVDTKVYEIQYKFDFDSNAIQQYLINIDAKS
jgi:glycosyltransferase involved in cell wall biosynthesis